MPQTTNEVSFDRKEVVPDESKLEQVLGEMYDGYQEILTMTERCPREWKYYGKKFGWQLKVMHKWKTLLYLSPLKGSFRVGLAVRDDEREALLNSSLPPKVKQELTAAKKYPEGYPLRFLVKRESDMKSVRLAIQMLRSMRP